MEIRGKITGRFRAAPTTRCSLTERETPNPHTMPSLNLQNGDPSGNRRVDEASGYADSHRHRYSTFTAEKRAVLGAKPSDLRLEHTATLFTGHSARGKKSGRICQESVLRDDRAGVAQADSLFRTPHLEPGAVERPELPLSQTSDCNQREDED